MSSPEVIMTTEGHDSRTTEQETKYQINLSRNCHGLSGTICCCYCHICDFHCHWIAIINSLHVSGTALLWILHLVLNNCKLLKAPLLLTLYILQELGQGDNLPRGPGA